MNKAQSLIDFFKKRSSAGYRRGGRERSTGSLTAEEFNNLIKIASNHMDVYEDILKFVKGHRKIARELDMEDIHLLFLAEVQSS